MSESDRIIREAQVDLRDRWEHYRDEFGPRGDEPHDVIHEIADQAVPIYTADRFEMIAADPNIAYRDLELAEPTTDMVTLAGIAIFEAIEEALWETWAEIEQETADALEAGE